MFANPVLEREPRTALQRTSAKFTPRRRRQRQGMAKTDARCCMPNRILLESYDPTLQRLTALFSVVDHVAKSVSNPCRRLWGVSLRWGVSCYDFHGGVAGADIKPESEIRHFRQLRLGTGTCTHLAGTNYVEKRKSFVPKLGITPA